MSTMEPDEGVQVDDEQADAPRWDKVEAANPDDAPGRERADPDDPDGGADS
jgi:hypothetical protein